MLLSRLRGTVRTMMKIDRSSGSHLIPQNVPEVVASWIVLEQTEVQKVMVHPLLVNCSGDFTKFCAQAEDLLRCRGLSVRKLRVSSL